MEMNAGDGSHHGTVIPKDTETKRLTGPLDGPAPLTLTLKVATRENYALHIDRRIGVQEHEWLEPITVEMEMPYTGEKLERIGDDPVAGSPGPVPPLSGTPDGGTMCPGSRASGNGYRGWIGNGSTRLGCVPVESAAVPVAPPSIGPIR